VNLELARAVADAVLYEGYLLYPYRASSDKNRVRWQFGVLGPPGALEASVGEEPTMSMQCLLNLSPGAVGGAGPPKASVVVHLRFLQLQRRQVCDGQGHPRQQLPVEGSTWTSWDEAVEQEATFDLPMSELVAGVDLPVAVRGGEDVEWLHDRRGDVVGHILRRRWPLSAHLGAAAIPLPDDFIRLELGVRNVTPGMGTDKDAAVRASLIGAHLLVEARGCSFVSLLDHPDEAGEAAAQCTQHRCWPVLTGQRGDTDLVLGSPIILYDYPEIAMQSAGALFDATEIDEILTLRVMTMTDQEKAEARATDPRSREIIDRCDAMSPAALQQLHGVLRNPHAMDPPPVAPFVGAGNGGPDDLRDIAPATFGDPDVPWWDPAADEAVRPESDVVVIDGVPVSKGSLVRVHPIRRADAQDLFFDGKLARVTAVLSDVDGEVHVALVLADDPAADLHDWFGRYWYFAPDELEPLSGQPTTSGEESRS
jgi:hypothetical protein